MAEPSLLREQAISELVDTLIASRSPAHGEVSLSELVAIKAAARSYFLDQEFDDE